MTFTIEQTETAIRYAVAKRGRDFVNNKEVDGNGTCQYLWQDEETGARRPSGRRQNASACRTLSGPSAPPSSAPQRI